MEMNELRIIGDKVEVVDMNILEAEEGYYFADITLADGKKERLKIDYNELLSILKQSAKIIEDHGDKLPDGY